MSKCRVCRGPAIIDLPRHNANFCAEHLQQLCRRQVEKAIADHSMLAPGERVLVAVSGGKDSLALWDLLLELGYEADGLYIGLGIGDYSDESGAFAQEFADDAGLDAQTHRPPRRPRLRRARPRLERPAGSRARRAACPSDVCSTTPRATAATARSRPGTTSTTRRPCCSATPCAGMSTTWLARCRCSRPATGFPRKVKPLVRLTERETAAWCITRGIDYQVEECPMAAGNRHLGYKATLNELEARSPGTKASFYLGFLERMGPVLADHRAAEVGRTLHVRSVRRADDRRDLRVLSPGRDRRRPRTGPRRGAHGETSSTMSAFAHRQLVDPAPVREREQARP